MKRRFILALKKQSNDKQNRIGVLLSKQSRMISIFSYYFYMLALVVVQQRNTYFTKSNLVVKEKEKIRFLFNSFHF